MKTQALSKKLKGFTLIEILFVLAIVTLLTSLAYPHFLNSRAKAQENACINNLRIIQAAKAQLALERGNYCCESEPSANDLNRYIYGGTASIKCPSSNLAFAQCYSVNRFCQPPTCNVNGNHLLKDVVSPCPSPSASASAAP